MKPRSHPLRIGLFAIGAIAVLATAIVMISGGRLFVRAEPAEMQFEGSVYGLQPGAPVVFRGVRVGQVVSVRVVEDGAGHFAVPVRVEIDRSMFQLRDAAAGPPELRALVQRGLTARLATQSLLTGLLYVDLDLEPSTKAAGAATTTPIRVPTRNTPIQNWQAQLEGLDLKQLTSDVSAAAAAARALLADPQLRPAITQTVTQMAQLTESLARASATLDKRLPPLADGVQASVGKAGEAALALAAAAQQLGRAADQVATVASKAQALVAPDSALIGSVRQAADQLGRSAATLNAAAAGDGALMQNLDGTLAEMRRASRAVRELAETLERNPEALLRGKPEPR